MPLSENAQTINPCPLKVRGRSPPSSGVQGSFGEHELVGGRVLSRPVGRCRPRPGRDGAKVVRR